jgi:hypothetical protein
LLAVATDDGLSLHDDATLEERCRFAFVPSRRGRMVFSPDGQTLAIDIGVSVALWPVRSLLGD